MFRVATGDGDSIGRGTKKVLGEELVIQLVEGRRSAYDRNGRRLALPTFKGPHKDPNRDFKVRRQTKWTDQAERLARLQHLKDVKFATPDELAASTKNLLHQLGQDKVHRNVLRGPWFPISIPQMEIDEENYGGVLDTIILPAVGSSYEAQYPGRRFYNHRKGTLAKQVSIIPQSRHGRLLEMMRRGPVNALYFATPLQGYGVETDVEQMATLPEQFLLCGAVDTAIAQVMYPDFLAEGWYTSGQDCAAVRWRSAGRTLGFWSGGGGLGFFGGDLDARGVCSGGLLFVEQ